MKKVRVSSRGHTSLPFAFIFPCRFKAGAAKECIREILREQLSVADSIKNKLRDEGFDRYKLIVQVVVGEQHGHTGDYRSHPCLFV
uniref:Uncharacterized protein n=1 Tax=Cyprinus carpio TaxID=7962 RepID=A0A8C1JW45_CYPCA